MGVTLKSCPSFLYWELLNVLVLLVSFIVVKIAATELLEKYATGQRNFAGIHIDPPSGARKFLKGVDLSNIILSGAYLDGISLVEVNLTGAQMIGAYCPRANFSLSDLTNADLTGACLWGANFQFANLRRVSFIRSNLTRANFEGASLTNAFLEKAILTRVDLSKIDWHEGWKGQQETMHNLQAYNAFLCETRLPNGEFIETPDWWDDGG